MSAQIIPLNVLADIARYTAGTIQGQQDFLRNLKNPPSDEQVAAILAHQKTEAAKIPGIWQEVSEQATNIPADRKRAWIDRKVCLLLEEGAGLLNDAEWKAAGLDPNPDMGTLAPFQQVKLGNLIAKKKASILVRFFHRLEFFPEATALLQEIQALSEIEQAKVIRQWMHENLELLATKGLMDPTEYNWNPHFREILPDFFPEEGLLFPNLAPQYLLLMLQASQEKKNDIGLFRKVIADARAQDIPRFSLGIRFRVACEENRPKVLHALINCNRFQDIPLDSLEQGLVSACINNHLEILHALINCNRFQDIPLDSLERGFSWACSQNHPEVVHALIHCGRFSEIPTRDLREFLWAPGNFWNPTVDPQIKDLLQEQLNKRQQEEQKSS